MKTSDRVKILEDALARIAKWHGEFPETGKFWDAEQTRPMSYSGAYGSMGERDYMRQVAQEALDTVKVDAPAKRDHCPEKLKPGGCQLHNLHCGYPKCNEPPTLGVSPCDSFDACGQQTSTECIRRGCALGAAVPAITDAMVEAGARVLCGEAFGAHANAEWGRRWARAVLTAALGVMGLDEAQPVAWLQVNAKEGEPTRRTLSFTRWTAEQHAYYNRPGYVGTETPLRADGVTVTGDQTKPPHTPMDKAN